MQNYPVTVVPIQVLELLRKVNVVYLQLKLMSPLGLGPSKAANRAATQCDHLHLGAGFRPECDPWTNEAPCL